jgi:8-oxo-dGTP diphosphatase
MPVSDQVVPRDRYMLIPRVLIFVTRGSRVLLLLGSATKRLWPSRYNGLGGHVEPGEDILSAAKRELLEEAGLALTTCPSSPSITGTPLIIEEVNRKTLSADSNPGLWLCGTIVVDTGSNPGIGVFVFTGECPEGETCASSEGTLHWVEFENISSLPSVEDLPALLSRIQGMKPGDPPFSASSFYGEDGKQVIKFLE